MYIFNDFIAIVFIFSYHLQLVNTSKALHYHSGSNNHTIKFLFHYTNYYIKEVKFELVFAKFDFLVFNIL